MNLQPVRGTSDPPSWGFPRPFQDLTAQLAGVFSLVYHYLSRHNDFDNALWIAVRRRKGGFVAYGRRVKDH